MCCHARASEMRSAVTWDRLPDRSRGPRSTPCPAWRTDLPSAGASELRPRTWRGRTRGFPRRTLEDKGVRIAAKPVSDTPHGMVARPAKRRAAVGGCRVGRPSCPAPDSWSWPPGASLDALPLLASTLGRSGRREVGGVGAGTTVQGACAAEHPLASRHPAMDIPRTSRTPKLTLSLRLGLCYQLNSRVASARVLARESRGPGP